MAKAKKKAPTPRSPVRNGRGRKLKVFRTAVGFDDAYVAAPSRKAALAAWGSSTDLFAAGAAEVVSDPALMKAALARPGVVVRVARGTDAEHLRALGAVGKDRDGSKSKKEAGSPIKPGMTKAGAGDAGSAIRPGMTKVRGRRPGRAAVARAEAALARAEERHRSALAALRAEERALDKRRRALEDKHRREVERAEAARDAAQERYRGAMAEWVED
jgi:hypothetical protein